MAPFHNGCKNLLLLWVGGWRHPGPVQSLQPRPGRVQPEGSVVRGHRAWRLRLLGEGICASCPGCWCWAGVWQAGRELPRPLVARACLRCCPVVHKTLDGLGRPFGVLEPFSGSQALQTVVMSTQLVSTSLSGFLCLRRRVASSTSSGEHSAAAKKLEMVRAALADTMW